MVVTDPVAEQASHLLHDEVEPLPKETLLLLQSVINNIVAKPNEAKFRRLPLSNAKVAEHIAKHENAMAFLYLTGFEVLDGEDNILTLPEESVNLQTLRTLLKMIQESQTVQLVNVPKNDEKDLDMDKRKKEMLEKRKKEKEERDKLRDKLKQDKQERKHMKTGVASVGKKLVKGGNVNRFEDVGVDLNAKGG
jgi:DNA integrity scanning protein DisA with diadenylate cyclase activity